MQLVDVTLSTPAENLALDEALLDEAEAAAAPSPLLRLWEPPTTMAVIGRGSRVDEEVDRTACRRAGVPVLRRCSGGAAIVAGPGCLMYAVVLPYEYAPGVRRIDEAHRFVLGRLADALGRCVPGVTAAGTSDLAVPGGDGRLRKFSGNSLRCLRRTLLYHGTLLYNFPLPTVAQLLRHPPRQPAYRENRAHGAFLANLEISRAELRRAVIEAFGAAAARPDWPRETTRRLARERYGNPAWNERQ